MRGHPLTIGSTGHLPNPRPMLELPFDGFAQSTLKCLPGSPSKLSRQFAGVNRIPVIVAGPVFDVGDQFPMRQNGIVGAKFIQDGTDTFHYLDIPLLIAAAYIVSLSRSSTRQHHAHRFAVVANI